MDAIDIEWQDLSKTRVTDFDHLDQRIVGKIFQKILTDDIVGALDDILHQTIKITGSKIAGICEMYDDYIKLINISDKSIECDAITFHNIHNGNLICKGIVEKTIIISNEYGTDPRKRTLPLDHFKINRYMGIPVIKGGECYGQLIMANKPEEYTESDIKKLYTCIYLLIHIMISQKYKEKYTIVDMLERESTVKKVKDDFVATISHEIRTPLTGIMGAMTMIPQLGPLNEKQLRHIEIATSCSIQLLDIINGILDYSRLTANILSITHEPFDFEEAINRAISIVESKATIKGLELVKKIGDLPKSIIGDKKRLIQILVNLLSNAIKFTDKGHITLSIDVEKSAKGENSKHIKFQVKDTGIGLTQEDQKHIFAAFSQRHKNAYNKQDGLGLGLAISKRLVELMGGKIMVKSEGLYRGSTFEFDILIDEVVDLEKYKARFETLTILTVDDKMENLLLLDDILTSWKIKTIMCNSADQALRYIKRGDHFDIAIIDIYMPHMSGIELAQYFAQIAPKLPLIGISSVEEQGKEWFDQYLLKPYNQAKIFSSIISCLENPKRVSAQSQPQPGNIRRSRETLKILIAEDDINTQFMISEMVDSCGFKNVKIVSNGQEAVDACRKEIFDVCLMDIKMPIMNGLEASKYIKNLHPHPAIIAVSAGVLDSDKTSYLKAGMDGYLGKPFTVTELDNILGRFVE